jgi:Cdc6-like AAA superfamily ATPase
MMGEEIGQKFTPNNLQPEDQANLTLEETNEWPHLNLDDVTFTLLIAISPHIVVMLDELDNLLRFDTILNGKPIGLGNRAN